MVVIQGIYFFNKQNIITNEKVCNYCNRINKLKTYTGFKFFHLYGIPLIPLGKKVVNNECSGCKTYIEFTPKKWKKRKEELQKELDSTPLSERKLFNYLKLKHQFIEEYESLDESTSYARKIEKEFTNNIEVDQYLATWYNSINEFDKAISIASRWPENDNMNYILAYSHYKKGLLNECLMYYKKIKVYSYQRDFNLLYSIAQNFDKKKEIRKAYDFYTLLTQKFESIIKNHYAIRKSISSIEKNY